MHEKEIVEKKNYLAKADSTDLDFAISPEESKAIYLKKADSAAVSQGQLGNLELMDDHGDIVATAVGDKKKEAAIIQEKEDQAIIDKKIADAKLHDNDDDTLDFSVDAEQAAADEAVIVKKKEFLAEQQEEQGFWNRDHSESLDRIAKRYMKAMGY
jgi:hypothetical protein